MRINLKNEASLLPVTALSFSNRLIFSGEGPYLHAYDPGSYSKIHEQRIFLSQTIHGIAICHEAAKQRLLLVWGGNLVCPVLLHITNGEIEFRLGKIVKADDWLLYGCFQQQNDYERKEYVTATFVTAHNALWALKINTKDISHIPLWRLTCYGSLSATLIPLTKSTNCLLYTAKIHWPASGPIVVVAGTAFGELVIRTLDVHPETVDVFNNKQVIKTYYNFQAHDGSVFGLDIVPLSHHLTENLKFLVASCSDDRTIRIWNVSLEDSTSPSDNIEMNISKEWPEGSPDIDGEQSQSRLSKPTLVAASWGHISRIWQVLFVNGSENKERIKEGVRLASFGEDATCQVWRMILDKPLSLDSGIQGRLENLSIYAHHSRKNIWAQSQMQFDDKSPLIATGGADGAILAVPLSQNIHVAYDCLRNEYSTNDSLSTRNAVKSYSFMGTGKLLLTTHQGYVLLCELRTPDSCDNSRSVSGAEDSFAACTLLGQYDEFRSYSLTAGVTSLSLGFIASTKGYIYCCNTRRILPLHITPVQGKVIGLFSERLCSQNFSEQQGTAGSRPVNTAFVCLLVTILGSNVANLHLVRSHASDEVDSKDDFSVTAGKTLFNIILPNDFIITSMQILATHNGTIILLLGSRSGLIAGYKVEKFVDRSFNEELNRQKADLTWSVQAHQDAVTSMTYISDDSSCREQDQDLRSTSYLITTGRDGNFSIYRSYNEFHQAPSMVHRTQLSWGPNIEGASYSSECKILLIWGFHSDKFVVFDEIAKQELQRVECGGAHRLWAFQPLERVYKAGRKLYQSHFLWNQASKLNVQSSAGPSHEIVRSGGHGREIKACAVRPRPLWSAEQGWMHLMATGSEDTDIRLFGYAITETQTEISTIRCISVLRGHNTGIQKLQWSRDGRFLFSSAGSEEFFIWRVRRVPLVNVGVVRTSKMMAVNDLKDLRVTDFEAIEDYETTLTADKSNDSDTFKILMSLSDSTLRCYRYTHLASSNTWELLWDGRYLTCCLTQVSFLSRHMGQTIVQTNADMRHRFILTAGTNGCISFWRANDRYDPTLLPLQIHEQSRPLNSFKVHQNTIKSIHSVLVDIDLQGKATYLIISGGDDNAIAFTLVEISEKSLDDLTQEEVEAPSQGICTATLSIPNAHAASVTAVAVVYQSNHEEASVVKNCRIATASNDQRLKLWDVSVDLREFGVNGISVKQVAQVFTPVADVGCLELLDDGRNGSKRAAVVVCGVGIDIWRIG